MINFISSKTITLDINSDRIRLIQVSGNNICQWACAPVAPGLINEGKILDPVTVGAKIKYLMESIGISAGKVIAGISGLYSLSGLVCVNKPRGQKIEEGIKSEAIKQWEHLTNEHYITWSEPVKNGDKFNSFVIGTPKNVIDTHIQAFKSIKVKPERMNLKGTALIRLVKQQDNVLIANMESSCLDVVLIVSRIPRIMYSIKRASSASTQDWISDMVFNLNQIIKFYNDKSSIKLLNSDLSLLLTGYLSSFPEIVDEIATATTCSLLPLKVLFKHPANMPINEFAVSIGLASGKN
ncbi:MAG: hypothetical protein NTV30_03645 [Chloroflexi bacterium]|nr:hypothetical protein [Chloroflexota bacterium]